MDPQQQQVYATESTKVDENNNQIGSQTVKQQQQQHYGGIMLLPLGDYSNSMAVVQAKHEPDLSGALLAPDPSGAGEQQAYQQHQVEGQQPAPVQQQQHTQARAPGQTGPKPRGRRKKIRTEPIRPICPQCEKQFSNQSALTKHKLTHSDERKFACQQCSKAFKRHDHLTGHMQTHSNRKPFNCTIQGCDKTYCDARSLRRHKENIHHIVTVKEPSSNGNSNATTANPATSNTSHPHSNGVTTNTATTTTATSDTADSKQPSHLLCRRMQRLNGTTNANSNTSTNEDFYQPKLDVLMCRPSANSTGPLTSADSLQQLPHHHSASINNHYSAHHMQVSYSADYASSQRFTFDPMEVITSSTNGSTQNQPTLGNGNMTAPHSADSITDSGLGLAVHYEQQQQQLQQSTLAPSSLVDSSGSVTHAQDGNQTSWTQVGNGSNLNHTNSDLHLSGPGDVTGNGFSTYSTLDENGNIQMHHQNGQQHSTAQHSSKQPSHLLCRRMQRLNGINGSNMISTTNEVYQPKLDVLMCRPASSSTTLNQLNSVDTLQQPQHQHHSANVNHHYQGHHMQASYSADYASQQQHHFTFDFTHPMDGNNSRHQPNLGHGNMNAPHSADSITDSGLGLNVHYEQPLTLGAQPLDESIGQSAIVTGGDGLRWAQMGSDGNLSQTGSNLHLNSGSSVISDISNGYHTPTYMTNNGHHHHHNQHHQAPYSADYASTQHFQFDELQHY